MAVTTTQLHQQNKRKIASIMDNRGSLIKSTEAENEYPSNQLVKSVSISPPTANTECFRSWRVCLAEESPKKSNENSDSSTYQSLNLQETDICCDSSDTSSNASHSALNNDEPIKEVLEYEVASTSNNEAFFTNDSSSGTDDFFLATVDFCRTSLCSSDFADTENDGSDTTYDSELSTADYWVCLKCKNKQNNPMFRFCEKCYQIRKTHYPPRPRLHRSRSTKKGRSSPPDFPNMQRSASETSETSKECVNATQTSTTKNLLLVNPRRALKRIGFDVSQDCSVWSSESSTNEDNASHYHEVHKCESKKLRLFEQPMKQNGSKSIGQLQSGKKKINQNLCEQDRVLSSKRKFSICKGTFKSLGKPEIRKKPIMSFGVSDTEKETNIFLSQSLCISTLDGTPKDSGFSSAPSSQEKITFCQKPNDGKADFLGAENSDTLSSELNDSDVPEMYNREKDNNSPSVQIGSGSTAGSSNTNETSSISKTVSISSVNLRQFNSFYPFIKSADCFDTLSRYDLCMTCLTEPKNGVFVHSRFLHLCCCYKCAIKIWNKSKKCPVCNCVVKNVMKLFVH